MTPTTRDRPAFLIVNADDLGMAPAVDRAIFRAHREGIVTSASLMATGSEFLAAVTELHRHPDLGIGVHLCLCDGVPILPASQIPSLVGPDGRLPSRQQAARRLVLGRVRQEEVAGEFRAQIERVLAAGIEVDHLDSHCHLHAHPTVWRALREVVEETGIRRVRRSEARPGIDFLHATLRRRVLGIGITLASRFSRRAPEPSLRSPDRFLGLVRSGEIDAGWICQAIRSLEPGSVTELMLHPGDGDVFPGLSEDHAPEQRRRELEAALAPQVRETLEACNVELTTYRQVTPC